MFELKRRDNLVDKGAKLWISGEVSGNFVAGVHNTGVVTATKKVANFSQRQVNFV